MHTIILSTPPQLRAGNKGHAVAETPTDVARTLLYCTCTYSGRLPPSFSIDQSTIPNIPFITEMCGTFMKVVYRILTAQIGLFACATLFCRKCGTEPLPWSFTRMLSQTCWRHSRILLEKERGREIWHKLRRNDAQRNQMGFKYQKSHIY